jgi:hypothetical protein
VRRDARESGPGVSEGNISAACAGLMLNIGDLDGSDTVRGDSFRVERYPNPVEQREMKPATKQIASRAFDLVRSVGLELPGVEAVTKYDGSPMLKVGGSFMAGVATHPSAEPGTLVVRAGLEEREWLMADAPETYYLTDHYRSYPLILVRLSQVDRGALRDLLTVSRRLTLEKRRDAGPAARNSSRHTP